MRYSLLVLMLLLILSACERQNTTENNFVFTYEVVNNQEVVSYTIDSLDYSLTKQVNQSDQQLIHLTESDVLYQRINALIVEMNLMAYNGGYYPNTLYPKQNVGIKDFPIYNYSCTYFYEGDYYYFYFEDYYQIDHIETIKYSESLKEVTILIEDLPEYEALNNETK